MDKRLFILVDDVARRRAAEYCMTAPAGQAVRFSPPTRSLEQNAKLHAIFTEVAKRERYIGRELTPQQWKTLFISGHSIATGLGADMVPGLEGEYCNIRESSAQMTVARMSSLIEYTTAWVAMNGAHNNTKE